MQVKPVRDTVLHALHLWRNLVASDTPACSDTGSSLKGVEINALSICLIKPHKLNQGACPITYANHICYCLHERINQFLPSLAVYTLLTSTSL